jgi:hypothetical protein
MKWGAIRFCREIKAAAKRARARPEEALVRLSDEGRLLEVTDLDCVHEIRLSRMTRIEFFETLFRGLKDEVAE